MKVYFLKGLYTEKQVHSGFWAEFEYAQDEGEVTLSLAGRTWYRAYCNGVYLLFGPARAGHYHARLDVVNLTPHLKAGKNVVFIELCGMNDGSQENTGEPSFVYAEIKQGEKTLVSPEQLLGMRLPQRATGTEKYSHARNYNERYTLDSEYELYRSEMPERERLEAIEPIELDVTFIDRELPEWDSGILDDLDWIGAFDVEKDESVKALAFFYEDAATYDKVGNPSVEAYNDVFTSFSGHVGEDCRSFKGKNAYAVDYDLKNGYAGFIGLEFTVDRDNVIDIIHADRHTYGGFPPRDDGCNRVLRLECKAGHYCFESFNPYYMRYLRLIVRNGGAFKIDRVYLRKNQYKDKRASYFVCDDEKLNRIFASAKQTFCANSTDVYMDCPDRERGGWLCDALFSARAEKYMFGNTAVDRAMIKNYLDLWSKDQSFKDFYCVYPSNIDTAMPTWSMYFIIQLYEYLKMSGDTALVEAFRERALALKEFYDGYTNKEGLLENIKGWLFIDWSVSNNVEYLNPVSLGINAIYSYCLRLIGEMYGDKSASEAADRIVRTVRSFKNENGLYPDCLTRDENGVLKPENKYTSACQYYCRYFLDEVRADEYDEIEQLIEGYGPCKQRDVNIYAGEADIFIGLMVRFDLLRKIGRFNEMQREIRALFGKMTDTEPGTLWESVTGASSRCHGFASNAGAMLIRDVLGIAEIDEINKTVTLAPHPDRLKFADGYATAQGGKITARWYVKNNILYFTATVPEGYEAITDYSGLQKQYCEIISDINTRKEDDE